MKNSLCTFLLALSVLAIATAKSPNNNEVFSMSAVHAMPEFPGGNKEMINYLNVNLDYTSEAREAGISGNVYASFVVSEEGEVLNIEVIQGLGYGLDEEVIRTLEEMPRWQPGLRSGIAVRTYFILPVYFNLK